MDLYYDKGLIAPLGSAINPIDQTRTRYKSTEFASPLRSTIPLLSLLKHQPAVLQAALGEIDISGSCNLHLEYTVAPPQGKGIPSHTDLFITSGDTSLSIEVKWTEPRYETIGKWLSQGTNPENRIDVANGWLGLLERYATHMPLKLDDFSDAIYQMVHRAASACSTGSKPRLAYMVFEAPANAQTASVTTIKTDLAHLRNLLGNPCDFPFYLIEVPLDFTATFNKVINLPKGSSSTAYQICADLFSPVQLFNFGKPRLTKI